MESSDREDDVNRTQKAAQVFQEIMNTPDQAFLRSSGIGEVYRHHSRGQKVAFIFGGSYGRDLQPVAPRMAGALHLCGH